MKSWTRANLGYFEEKHMSGGSYDYCYHRVEEFAENMCSKELDPRREAFRKVLKLVAEAMRDVEWVDSGDYSTGAEHDAIDKLLIGLGADPLIVTKATAYDMLEAMFKKANREKIL